MKAYVLLYYISYLDVAKLYNIRLTSSSSVVQIDVTLICDFMLSNITWKKD